MILPARTAPAGAPAINAESIYLKSRLQLTIATGVCGWISRVARRNGNIVCVCAGGLYCTFQNKLSLSIFLVKGQRLAHKIITQFFAFFDGAAVSHGGCNRDVYGTVLLEEMRRHLFVWRCDVFAVIYATTCAS